MIRVYYKSDYKIRETFTTQAGVVIDPRNFNFEFVFIAGKENTFTCSHTIGAANEWVNCVYDSENNAVLCMLDNHNLLPGRLKRELTIEEPDSDFPDGKLDYVTYKAYEIELVETPDGDSIYDIYDDETIISGNISSAILSQILHNVDVKDNIKDADELNYLDSGNGFGIVKTTWLNIKAKLKAYFDTIYASITHNHEPVQVTYAELYALKQSNNLTPDQVYEITDYVTTYKQPISGSSLSGEVEPLLVTAITNNSLHIKAKSTIYPLHEIWYNIENIQEIAYGSTKGFIYRRKDEKNNDIGFDFMNVKFRRWQVTGNAWEVGIIYAKKSVVKRGNYLYISTIDNNVGIDPDVNNTTIDDLDSYYWIRCNFPDLSYVSCTANGNISPGKLDLTFAVTGLYEDYLMFSTPEIYAMSKNNFINNDWHQNHIGYNMFIMNNTVFMNNVLTEVYGSYDGVTNNVLQGDVQCNTILSGFNQNHISTTFYSLIISDCFDNNIIQSHFRHSFLNGGASHIESLCWEVGNSIFGGRITASNFANRCYYDNIFAKDIDCVSFLKDGRNSQFLNKISYCDIYRIDYDIFERELNNVTIKTFNQYNTIKAKLTEVTFEDNISYLKTGTNNIKDVIFGKNIANADLTTLVYPTTHCRIETVEGTPDKLCIKYLNADGRQCYSIVGLDASVIETGVYETETNKEADIETYKESTTKYPTLKGLYDWAVAKFLLATKLVTSWSAIPSNDNVPSEKLVKDSLDDKANLAGGNTFTGDQVFDSDTLVIDATDHRVGIGTITPTYKLDVRGTAATDGIRSCMGLDICPVPNPIEPTIIEMTSGGLVDVGDHYYACTYMTALGETNKGNSIKITVTSPNQTVKIGVPVSTDPRVTARKVFRTKAGDPYYNEYYLATINDNTTTEYIDTTADSGLTGSARPVNTRMNTTSKQITLNGVRALFIDYRNTIIGLAAGSKITTGGVNFLAGFNAGGALTTGSENVAILGLGSLATGNGNVGIGASSLNAAVTAESCVGIGYYALGNCTGNFNVGIGSSVLIGITTATYVVGLGYGAGSLIADGTTAKQTGNYGVYIGANTKALSNGTENEVAIGYGCIGNGSNTVTLGNNNIADTYLKGRTHVTSSIQINNDTASASAANAGAIRYRADANNSYVEMCMQTGASTYAWVVIKQNTW